MNVVMSKKDGPFRLGSLRGQATVDELFQLLDEGDEERFIREVRLRDNVKDLSKFDEGHATTLLYCAVEKKLERAVEVLLEREVDPNIPHSFQKSYPIHGAVNSTLSVFRALLEHKPTICDVRDAKERTILHLIVLDKALSRDHKLEMIGDIQRLRGKDFPVDAKDIFNCSAMFYAAQDNDISLILLLAVEMGANVNLKCGDDGGTTAELLKEAKQWVRVKTALMNAGKVTTSMAQGTDRIWEMLKSGNDDDIISEINALSTEELSRPREGLTLLCYACDTLREDVALALLDKGVDLQEVDTKLRMNALHYACRHGLADIVNRMLELASERTQLEEIINSRDKYEFTPLIHVMRRISSSMKSSDYPRCLQLLLNKRVDLNSKDQHGNTALHYAVTSWTMDTVKNLLEHGAKMFITNHRGDVPLDKIPPAALWEYLDSCLITNLKSPADIDKDDFSVTLDYNFLVQEGRAAPETTCLYWMVKNGRHLDTLKHPILRTFLHFKWQKIFPLFSLNCLLYVFYLALMFIYLMGGAFPAMLSTIKAGEAVSGSADDPCILKASFSLSSGQSFDVESNSCGSTNSQSSGTPTDGGDQTSYFQNLSREWNVVRWILFGTNSLILLLEIFQFLISPLKYMFSVENLSEMIMIGAVYIFILLDHVHGGRISGAIAVLFSLSEVTRLFGQLPVFSLYVKMFTTIAGNFIKFLLWYAVLLVVYSFCFLFLFHPSEEFASPFTSFLKTIAMLAGELGFENLPFDNYTGISHLAFITFVFFITIVLANLLTGLAVGETQEIKEKAEILGYVSEIKLIFYMESMFLRDPDNIFRGFSLRESVNRKCRRSMLGRYILARVLCCRSNRLQPFKTEPTVGCSPCGAVGCSPCGAVVSRVPILKKALDRAAELALVFKPSQQNIRSREILLYPNEAIWRRVGNEDLTLDDLEAQNLFRYVHQRDVVSVNEQQQASELESLKQKLQGILDLLKRQKERTTDWEVL